MRKDDADAILRRVLEEVRAPLLADADAIGIMTRAGPVRLAPRWIGEGFPQDVHAAMHRTSDDESVPVLVARRMSPGGESLLAEHDLNWIDLQGHASIRLDGFYLQLGSRARDAAMHARRLERTTQPMVWTLSAGAVAEVLLDVATRRSGNAARVPFEIPRIQNIADASGWSTAQVGKVLQGFDTAGFTRKSGSERGSSSQRTLVQPGGLLSEWAGWYRRKLAKELRVSGILTGREAYVSWLSAHFGAEGLWLTGRAALDEYAPFLLGADRVEAYVSMSDLDELRERVERTSELRAVDRGERVALMLADRAVESTGRVARGQHIVSPIRLYGDLLRHGGRFEEAANELRETAIGI